jgi:hypothetical protein
MYRNFADVWDVLIVEPEEPAKNALIEETHCK